MRKSFTPNFESRLFLSFLPLPLPLSTLDDEAGKEREPGFEVVLHPDCPKRLFLLYFLKRFPVPQTNVVAVELQSETKKRKKTDQRREAKTDQIFYKGFEFRYSVVLARPKRYLNQLQYQFFFLTELHFPYKATYVLEFKIPFAA